jgi:hypothetical protein
MSTFDRRQFLNGVLTRLALATGTVVLASTAAPAARTTSSRPAGTGGPPEDIQKRADQLPAEDTSVEESAAEVNEFLNGAFRNTPWGGFRNTPGGGFGNSPVGRFRNTPLGGFGNSPVGRFRNTPGAGFRNTPLGSFKNSTWPNGGWGGFYNGGWPNGGWANWW